MLLSRKELCTLGNFDVEQFKGQRRLGRTPEMPQRYQNSKGFTPLEAFALATAHEFIVAHSISYERAAGICSGIEAVIAQWKAIELHSRELPPVDEIMFGRLMFAGATPPQAVCGTSGDLAELYPTSIGTITLSISRVAYIFRNRARRNKIDLAEFWLDPTVGAARPRRVVQRNRESSR